MSSKLDYFSIGSTVDGTNYCSGVETLAENLIEDNESDEVIAFPSKNGWASLQAENYVITTENAEAILPSPIYKVKKLLVKIKDLKIKFSTGESAKTFKISDFKNENGDSIIEEFDITSFVVDEVVWSALPVSSSQNEYLEKTVKDNTFPWKNGSNKIPFVGTVYQLGLSVGGDSSPVYMRVLKSYLVKNGESYKVRADGVDWSISGTMRIGADLITDIREWYYRIEYIPLTSKTKIRARKTAKQEVEYLQPFNQRAEINAASSFGKNMWLIAQKTGTEQITVVKNYTKLNDIPPLGAVVKHNGKKYRLVANSYKQTNTIYIQVTHTLSENWTSKSKHVSVNQKYRNYNIPRDILWRNMYWEDYITVSSTAKTVAEDTATGKILDKAIQLFYVPSTNDGTIDTLCWMFNGKVVESVQNVGALVPSSTIGVANSMVISASFKDNLSAGIRRTIKDKNLSEEALYCNDDGTLESATVILSDGYGNGVYQNGTLEENNDATYLEESQQIYPSIVKSLVLQDTYYNAPKTPIFEKNFYVDKDPGEAIKFTYQVHFVTEGDCVVGNKVAEHNPLIKRYEKSNTARQFKVWLLKDHIREGEDLIVPTDNYLALSQKANGDCFTVWHPTGGNNARISLKDEVKAKLVDYKAWAITDENNHLYVGRNENQEGIVHLCISHKRN